MTGNFFRRGFLAVALLAAGGLHSVGLAHPEPEIPVHSSFEPTGRATISIELDPRCFEEDPENAPYLLEKEFETKPSPDDRAELLRKAKAFIPQRVQFETRPGGMLAPEFECEFATREGIGLEEGQKIVVVKAEATLDLPAEATGYRVHAIDEGYLTVMFTNEIGGEPVERFQALFPGQTSYWLDLPARDQPAQDQPAFSAPWLLIWFAAIAVLLTAALLIRRAVMRAS